MKAKREERRRDFRREPAALDGGPVGAGTLKDESTANEELRGTTEYEMGATDEAPG